MARNRTHPLVSVILWFSLIMGLVLVIWYFASRDMYDAGREGRELNERQQRLLYPSKR